jgi:hypothetical protein
MARAVLLLAFCSYAAATNSTDWSKVIEKGGGAVKDLISDGMDGAPVLKDIADTISGIGSLTSVVCPGPVGAFIGAGLGFVGGILGIFVPSKPQTSLDDVLGAVTKGFNYVDSKLDSISLSLDKLNNTMTAYFTELQDQLKEIKVMIAKIYWYDKFGKELDQITGTFGSVQAGMRLAVNQFYSGALDDPIKLLQEKFSEYEINLNPSGPWSSKKTMDYIAEIMSGSGIGVGLYAYERIMTGRVQMFVMMHMKQQFDITSVTSKEAYGYKLNQTKSYADSFYAEQQAIQARMQSLLPDGYVGQDGVKEFLASNQIQLITGAGFELNGRYMLNETKNSLEAALKATPAGFKPGKRVLIVTWSDATRQFCLMTGKQQWDPNLAVPTVIPSYQDMITASGLLRWPENSGVRLLNDDSISQDSLQFCTTGHDIPPAAHSVEMQNAGVNITQLWQNAGVNAQTIPTAVADCWGEGAWGWKCCSCIFFGTWQCGWSMDTSSQPCNLVLFHYQKGWFWNPTTQHIQYGEWLHMNYKGQRHFYADRPSNVCDTIPDWSQIDNQVFYLTLHTAKLVQPISASPPETIHV